MRADRRRVSVIIPTYNRSEILRETLHQLTRQSIPVDDFEVIVADDGSTDQTKAVVDSFAGRLHMKYHWQEDLGFRAGHARNAGARLAVGNLLVFLDTGAMAGPDFLRDHLAEHDAGRKGVIGYAYGYNPDDPLDEIGAVMAQMPPEQVVAHYAGRSGFLDIRHGWYEKCGFDLSRLTIPWMMAFSINMSVRARDFHEVGGFDEGFDRWGAEDMHLGYKLLKHGVPLALSRTAWVVEFPHERDRESGMQEVSINLRYFLRMHPEPAVELLALLIPRILFWTCDDEFRAILDWEASVRDLDVSPELARAAAEIAPSDRIAVIGAGGSVPTGLPQAELFDFDAELAARSGAHHLMGLLTPLGSQSVDTVVFTSRMAGLWPRWGEDLLAEAQRVGRKVHFTFAHS
ncbi:glycosyltransferase [Acrocarpospora catenulata]|uniref:glycosyltransferase n=1 Tax=Acrocarpospora catenulata TaxID=2836182 RepID=UPI001BDB4640|nr:glycosyltransferase [Acrocarpospora catenulata]